MSKAPLSARSDLLRSILDTRIAILDGAMGTMVHQLGLDEDGFRGQRFASHHRDLKNCIDVLTLSQGDAIRGIHAAYLEAGADIVETNTFGATSMALADFGLQEHTREMNLVAASLARAAADEATAKTPDRPRFVAGSIGPTNKQLSIAGNVADPGHRDVTYDEMVAAYREQIEALIEGGVDILLAETAFDTLVLKACLHAIEQTFSDLGRSLPVMASFTIFEGGRTLSAQTVEACWTSISHVDLLSAGINCALGPEKLRTHVADLSRATPRLVSCYPNAGLPNALGGFDETPEMMASVLEEYAQSGWLNIVGGCCGTTPAHIKAIADTMRNYPPRKPAEPPRRSRYSGLEMLEIRPETSFTIIGERTNVTGSRAFARLIKEERYDKLLTARPIMPLGRDIGYLPGDKDEKLSMWMQPIFDNVGYLLSTRSAGQGDADSKSTEQRLDQLMATGKLVMEPLTYIRGRSIPHQFMIIDEAQNLSPHEIKTIVSRVGDGTKIVLCGDIGQIDNPYLDAASNGLAHAIERLKGQTIAGHVTLSKTERSELASLAAEVL
jgi:5-methyltetrahydrofolate--homocysteine methyltransferase